MSLFLMTSAARSPGVTTMAVAMAVHAEEPMLLVDANREPDQSVLAGYLRGQDPEGRGLSGLLQAYREHIPLANVLPSMVIGLGENSQFMPGFAQPGMVSLFTPVWPELASTLATDSRTVVVDIGRIGTQGLPPSLVDVCAGVIVVTRSALPDLAALRLYLPLVQEAAGPDRVGLAIIGPGRPYRTTEIRRRFDLPVWGQLAWEPSEVEEFSHGTPVARRRNPQRYRDDIVHFSRRLRAREAGRRELIGAPL